MEPKELYPGLFLIRQQQEVQDVTYFTFTVDNTLLKVCEFSADFDGSTNFILEQAPPGVLKHVTIVDPLEKKVVATVRVRDPLDVWKLKSKWSYSLFDPPPQQLAQLIQPDVQRLHREVEAAKSVLGKFPVDLADVVTLRQHLEKHKTRFIDLDFPPSDSSLYPDPSSPPLDTPVHWRRPHEFLPPGSAIDVFQGNIEPSDIRQGALGDCWFMCALSSLAERPELVRRLFVTQTYNPQGFYRIKLCKNGEWKIITVDDLFPCYPNGGPIFSQARDGELWVLLLEKAYAKLHGSYYLLRGGWASEGMMDLTGCPTDSYHFRMSEDVQRKIESGQLWNDMRDFDNAGYLISASTPGEDRWTETGEPLDEGAMRGLVPGHAYTVIAVKEAHGNRLLQIRNPWGNFEWNGDWSDNSPLWTPQMMQALNQSKGDDGTFWMSWQDFVQYFDSVNVCRVHNWDEIRLKGHFVKKAESVISKNYYVLNITQTSRIFIGVHQEDERIHAVAAKRGYIDIGCAVLVKRDDNLDLVDFAQTTIGRQCQVEVVLEPGEYIVVPRTAGCYLRRPPDITDVDPVPIILENHLHPDIQSAVNDVFRKYNVEIDKELSFEEFNALWQDMEGGPLNPAVFKQLLERYTSTESGISNRGLLDFFRDTALEKGEAYVWSWLTNLGYDQELHSIRSRTYVLTFHSEIPIAVSLHDVSDEGLDDVTTSLIVMRHGTPSDPSKGVIIYSAHFGESHTYSYVVQNKRATTIEVKFDCSSSQNMVPSGTSPIVTKRVAPQETAFLLHMQAMKSASSYCGQWRMSWKAC